MGSVSQSTPFGKPMREHFLFDKNFKNLNHGSFGTYPKPVRDQLRHFQDLAEARPDQFMRYQYEDLLLASRTAIAHLLNVPVITCVFVQNATLGINTVLRNLVYGPGDVIIYFDTIYGACEKTIESILETTPHVRARKVDGYEFPCEHGEIVERFVEVVEGLEGEGLRAKVAVFDTICALPGVRFPFERLTVECRRLGVLSCIDAAHGVGHIPLDLGTLDPDFFVSNCHKWLFTPRGSAIFHVPSRNQPLIRTAFPTSHGFVPPPSNTSSGPILNPLPPPSHPLTSTPFTTLFQYVATTDNGPYYCIPRALHFRRQTCGGEDAVADYLRAIARRGGDLVAQRLGTEVMDTPDHSLRDCAFANVRLPIAVGATGTETEAGSGDDVAMREAGSVVDWMQRCLVEEFDTFIAVFAYKGRLWTRLSAQVYLEEGDFEWAAGVLEVVCQRVREGVWRVGEGVVKGQAEEKEKEKREVVDRDEGKVRDVGERLSGLSVKPE